MDVHLSFDAENLSTIFNRCAGDLTSFIKKNPEKELESKQLLTTIFNSMRKDGFQGAIKELIIENFDEEQIWAQLEIDNKSHLEQLVKDISSFSIISRKRQEGRKKRQAKRSEVSDEIGDVGSSEEEEDLEIDEEAEPVNRNLSSFERQQAELKARISNLEEENLKKKPWKLIGEVTGDRRPENSLLEEALQYDFVSRPAPVISEEITAKVEDIIKQRIKDKTWDDVERKKKPTELPFEYKRRLTLEHDKSKIGLAEVYEKEFLDKQKQDKQEEECEAHKEIRKFMSNLFIQLDALSNYNYTPKPPEPEIKIINNLPAITAEEPIPISVGEDALLAPEEIMPKPKPPVKRKHRKGGAKPVTKVQ